MNVEKAREYFSAYQEGTLDGGLRQAFEQELAMNPSLMAEFETFKVTLARLESLRFEAIDIPQDLSERIQARLDRHVWEEKRKTPAPWTMWLRNLALGGLGTAAIVGAVIGLNQRGPVAGAGAINLSHTVDQLQVTRINQGVEVSYKPSSPKTVLLRDGQGNILKTVEISGQTWESGLTNPTENPVVYSVEIQGESNETTYVIPGQSKSTVNAGDATILDLAKAAASFYNIPVALKTNVKDEAVSWSFNAQVKAVDAVSVAVSQKYTVELLDSGVLSIRQK
jgi:hypothetical protein